MSQSTPRAGDPSVYPLSHAQQRIWLTEQFHPGTPIANLAGLLLVRGSVRLELLAEALERFARTTEALQLEFLLHGGQLLQRRASRPPPRPEVVDFSAEPDPEAAAERWGRARARMPFSPLEGPLFHLAVVKLGEERGGYFACLHHLIGDGFSLGLLARSVTRIYEALRAGREPEVQGGSYARFVERERAWLASPAAEQERRLWHERLSGLDEPALLRAVGSPLDSTLTVRHSLVLDEATTREVREQAQRAGSTPPRFFAALTGLFVSRLTGRRDVCLGMFVHGRSVREDLLTCGMMVGTVPLRFQVERGGTFEHLLRDVGSAQHQALKLSRYPFDLLTQQLRTGALQGAPLFDVLVSFQTGRFDASLEGHPVDIHWFSNGHETHSLALHVNDRTAQGRLQLDLDFRESAFPAEVPAELARSLRHLLDEVLAAGREQTQRPVSGLSVVSPPQAARLAAWNPEPRPFPREHTVAELLSQRAARAPGRVAVRAGTRCLTFGELEDRAGAVAAALSARGAGPGGVVGLLVARSEQLLVGQLGILQSGAAYLPLDAHQPRERLAMLAADAGVRLLVADGQSVALSGGLGLDVIRVDAVDAVAAPMSPRARPEDVAYVLYTSGSTGKPKGVQVPHRAVVNFLAAMVEALPLDGEGLRFLCTTTSTFDIFALETLLPLWLGHEVVMADEEAQRSPDTLGALILESGCHLVQLTPSRLQLLLETPVGREALAAVRLVLVGGEAMPDHLLARLRTLTRARIFNMYGPTETTVWSTVGELTHKTRVDVGRPVLNTQVLVLGPEGEPLPPGVVGELCIAGQGLARGYLGRPGLTAERFIASPLGHGERMYRTGDRARWLPTGELEHHGRIDLQVKLRGHRIEPGEIEAQLVTSGLASAAAVVVRQEPGLGAVLAAFYVPTRDPRPPREVLSRTLPEYMVPTHFVTLSALPTLPSGKVDRHALVLVIGQAGLEREGIAPSTETERRLLALFSQVLGVERLGVTDGFFELGGHSLLAVKLVHQVAEVFARALPLADVFQAPTVRALAPRVDAAPSLQAPVPRLAEAAHSPASSAQRQLFILQEQGGAGDTRYHMTGALAVSGPLDVTRLEAALRALVQRHEAFRTSFVLVDGEVVQRVAPSVPFTLERPAPGGEVRELARRFVRPFDLGSAPLLRAGLVEREGEPALLLVDLHHLISDATSVALVLAELVALYDGKPLPPPGPRPAEVASWQRARLETPEGVAHGTYWTQRFAEPPPPLDLPADGVRTAQASLEAGVHSVTLPPELTERLRHLCRRQDTTLFNGLLAAFSVLLSRHGATRDVVVGTPVLGRTHPQLREAVGFLVDTLALRNEVREALSFVAFLAQVSRHTAEALEHQEFPFAHLVEALHARGGLARGSLFDVLFGLQEEGSAVLACESGPRLERLDDPLASSKVELTLTAQVREGGALRLEWSYRTALFSAERIARMAERYLHLLESVVARPGAALRDLDMYGPSERARLRDGFNTQRHDYPLQRTLGELFEEQAALHPEALAAWHEGSGLTYRELDTRTNQLARRLRSLGVGRETVVAVLARPSLEMVVGILAVVKAGGTYLPMDPAHPAERIELLLQDAGARLLLEDVSHPEVRFEDTRLPLSAPSSFDADASPLPRVNAPEDLLYVIYTSGTTGRPKGVMVEHRALCNQVYWLRRMFSPAGRMRHLLLVSPAVDVSVHQLFLPLMRGDALFLPTYETLLSPEGLYAYVVEHHIDVVDSVPALLKGLLAHGTGSAKLQVPYLCFGGDVLSASVVELVERHAEISTLINYYGPTEACLNTTALFTRDWRQYTQVPIGPPVDNYRVHLVDEHLNLVPPGSVGELCVAGVGLARGYLGRPDLTAERFVPNPFASGERMYRTGDLGRWLPDGKIAFLGRVDHQVKIRGFRVETAEIEAVISRLPGVADCVVEALDEADGDKRLAAFLVPRAGEGLDPAQVREALKARLPAYMVPSVLVPLPALPVTASGKLDRKALAGLARSVGTATALSRPLTPFEQRVAALWSEVLGAPVSQPSDDFFDHGGHSLQATQVRSRVTRELGLDAPLRLLFEHPLLEEYARALEGLRPSGPSAPVAPIPAVARSGGLPLSSAQQRLWFLDQLEPGSPIYNIAGAVLLDGALDEAALAAAFGALVARHESLRTTFSAKDGGCVQIIHPEARFTLEVENPHGQPEVRAGELEPLLARAAQQPFSLEHGPLLRVRLVRLEAGRHAVLVVMHHIISDGWSINVLLREFAALYAGRLGGAPVSLAPLPIQYADYAVWQRQGEGAAGLAEDLAFWKEHLGTSPPPLRLPTDRPRPSVLTHSGALLSGRWPLPLLQGLQEVSRQGGRTLFMTLMAAFQAFLHRYTGQRTVIVGTPIANRTRAETEGLIGCFVNTLALRADVDPEQSFEAFARGVGRSVLSAFTHQGLPFDVLVEQLGVERDMSQSPLVQVLFALQNAPGGPVELPGLRMSPVEVSTGTARFELSVVLTEEPEGLAYTFEYNTDLFKPETLQRLMRGFQMLLEGVARQPDVPVHALPVVAPEEQRFLASLDQTAQPVEYRLAREMLEAQARLRPEAPALQHRGVQVTFAEWDRRANQLAWALRARGVGPGSVVALSLEPSLDVLVVFFGILKAGAAYVPLDPSYPQDRLAFMLKDSGARVFLTREHLLGQLPVPEGVEVFVWEREQEDLAQRPAGPPPAWDAPDSLAYLIYTSGSTGLPKAVMISNGAMVNYSAATARAYGLRQTDRALLLSPISFDMSLEQILPCLYVGGLLVIREENTLDSVERFIGQVREWGIGFLSMPAALWAELAAELDQGRIQLPPSVRVVNSGGEKILPSRVLAWRRAVSPSVQMMNSYGPTETTVICLTCNLTTLEQEILETHEVPLGRAIGNLRVYVLDKRLRPVARGVSGEIFVGGAGVGLGYHRRPELTAERFIPDPFSPTPGGRLYRTGDVARLLDNGMVEYLGRGDHQVKIRGFRIELGEIESALSQHPEVKDAVVVVREEPPAGKRLVAYVTPRGEARPSGAGLRGFLKSHMPDYMIPHAYVVLEALPIAPGGKVDRKRLPAPEREEGQGFVEPQGELQQAIAALYSAVLSVPRVSATDDFFSLGGHSLLATQLIARLRDTLSLEVPLKLVFENPSVEALARAVESLRQQGAGAGEERIGRVSRQGRKVKR